MTPRLPARMRRTAAAALMLAAGLVAAFLGVNAERRKLEDVATPLSAESAAREPSLAQR